MEDTERTTSPISKTTKRAVTELQSYKVTENISNSSQESKTAVQVKVTNETRQNDLQGGMARVDDSHYNTYRPYSQVKGQLTSWRD